MHRSGRAIYAPRMGAERRLEPRNPGCIGTASIGDIHTPSVFPDGSPATNAYVCISVCRSRTIPLAKPSRCIRRAVPQ